MKKKIFIEGMSCQNCAKHVKEALSELAGVISAEVNLAEKFAVVETNTEIEDKDFIDAIEEIDYNVSKVEVL